MRAYYLLIACLLFFQELYPSKFVVITPPKCGTNLVSRALYLMTKKIPYHHRDYHLYRIDQFFEELEKQEKENLFIQTHLAPQKKLVEGLIERNYQIITIIRDPRDQLISALHWIQRGKDIDHIFEVPVDIFNYLAQDIQIDEMMTGELFGYRIFDRAYRLYYGWLELDPSRVLVLRFEDLVGPKGGGSIEKQNEALHKLASRIGITLTDEMAASIGNDLFGISHTFRSGQIGEWKSVFTPEQKKRFEEIYSTDLLYLGF